jgi:hypothetical protein
MRWTFKTKRARKDALQALADMIIVEAQNAGGTRDQAIIASRRVLRWWLTGNPDWPLVGEDRELFAVACDTLTSAEMTKFLETVKKPTSNVVSEIESGPWSHPSR